MDFLKGKELKLYLLITAVLAVFALAGTAGVMLLKNRPRESSTEAIPFQPGHSGIENLDPAMDVFKELLIPEEFGHLFRRDWKPFRPRFAVWQAEQVDEFWLDPGELVRRELEARTEEEMKHFFEGLPW
jgi:hypothetical protein